MFAVSEYMKGGHVVTHPCALASKNRVLHLVPVSFPQAMYHRKKGFQAEHL